MNGAIILSNSQALSVNLPFSLMDNTELNGFLIVLHRICFMSLFVCVDVWSGVCHDTSVGVKRLL